MFIDNGGRLNSKLYHKRGDFDFPIVKFPFLSSNIPASRSYGVCISQLIRYAKAFVQYGNFLEKGQLLSQKLPGQGYVKLQLESSLSKFYCRHHELVDHYGISFSQMTIDMFA